MNTLSTTTSLLTHSLTWALLYSLWQGLLVYVTLFILLKAIPDASARIKHYLSLGAFVALFAWFADTWLIQFQKLKGITVYVTQSAGDAGLPAATHAVKTLATGTQGGSGFLHHLAPGLEHY